MIPTVYSDQTVALLAARMLYLDGEQFDADLTWGNGKFWVKDAPPKIRVDLAPMPGANLQADIRALPFADGSLRSAVVDLPFIHAHGKDSVMGQRFSSYPSQRALDDLHHVAAAELRRVLAPGGIVAWKCQDIVESGKQVWNHVRIHYHCGQVDLRAEDLFILVRKGAMIGHNHHRQQHARRTHSYIWIFRRHG